MAASGWRPKTRHSFIRWSRREGARISITGSVGRGDGPVLRGRDDGQVASNHHHRSRHDRAYARRGSPEEPPLAYAPLAPSYDDWMHDPFGNLGGY